jgi:hypothetical protein
VNIDNYISFLNINTNAFHIIDGLYPWESASHSYNLYTGTAPGQDFVIDKGLGEILETNLSKIFVDYANGDYRLRNNSPAIDSGANLAGIVDYDIEGNVRPRGSGWDIGAYESNYTRDITDTTPPTFTSSSSFAAAENIATSATAATIRVSESATVIISSGADAARFNISRSETNTAIIKFNSSPDFEAPVDSGGNNVYDLTLTATDTAGNAGAQSITITVTDVVDTSAFSLFQLAGGATVAAYRTAIVITATVNVASKISFNSNGKVLPGCKNRLATGSGSSFTATCSWRPSNRGSVALTALAAPTGAGISSSSAPQLNIRVGNRTGPR